MLKISGISAILLSLLAVAAATQSIPTSADRAAVGRAQKMYYSLQSQGVRELRCVAHPDWAEVLAGMQAASANAKARALPYLSKIQFRAVVTAFGANVTVERTAEQSPADLVNLEKLVDLVRFNVQQSLDTWRMMSFKPLLPDSVMKYRFESYDERYKITPLSKNAGQIILSKDWVIQEITSSIPEQHVTWSIRPQYVKSPAGLLLSSLDEENANNPSQRWEMKIDYAEVDGIQVPAAFGPNSEHPGGGVDFSVKFEPLRCNKALTVIRSARPIHS